MTVLQRAWVTFLLLLALIVWTLVWYQNGRNNVCQKRGYDVYDVKFGACARQRTVVEYEK